MIMEKNEFLRKYIMNSTEGFPYMLLSRMQSDCGYYLENGNRLAKYLWANDEKAHIAYMRYIWEFLPEKPEWLTMEEINDYAKKMGVA